MKNTKKSGFITLTCILTAGFLLLTPLSQTFAWLYPGKDDGSAGLESGVSVSGDPFTGAATMSYPLFAPPGRGKMTPQINVNYSSQNRDKTSWLGTGWDLSFGYIERSRKKGVPTYTDWIDTFVLFLPGQANELVPIKQEPDGSYLYQAKTESAFNKIYYISYSTSPGDGYWLVIDRSGTKYYFGQDANSQDVSYNGVFRWYLYKVEDTDYNLMELAYKGIPQSQNRSPKYLYSITYGGGEIFNDVVGLIKINFNTETRPDVFTDYSYGDEASAGDFGMRYNQRLKDISIEVNGKDYGKIYEFSYYDSTTEPISHCSLLKSITQYDIEDKTKSLPPITFEYYKLSKEKYYDTNGISIVYLLRGATNEYVFIDLVDINGDGLLDMVKADGSHWNIYYNPGNDEAWPSTSEPEEWDVPNNSYIAEKIGSGNYKGSITKGLFDMNGDGLVDLVKGDSDGTWQVWFNTGSGFEDVDGDGTEWQAPQNSEYLQEYKYSSHIVTSSLIDMNGDGLVDYVTNTEYAGGWTWDIYYNNGNRFNAKKEFVKSARYPITKMDSKGNIEGDTLDINGDGLPDIICALEDENGYLIFGGSLNTGSNFDDLSDYYTTSIKVDDIGGKPYVLWGEDVYYDTITFKKIMTKLIDMNADGLPDFIKQNIDDENEPYDGGNISIYYNTGSNFIYAGDFWSYFYLDSLAELKFTYDDHEYLESDIFDIDGNGIPDRLTMMGSYHFKTEGNDNGYPGLLKEVNNGIGGITRISYKSAAQYQEKDGSLSNTDIPFPIITMESMSQEENSGEEFDIPGEHSYKTTYHYKGGKFDGEDREFRGFGYVTAYDTDGNYKTTWFHQDDVKKGLVYYSVAEDKMGNWYKNNSNTYESKDIYGNGKVYFPKLTNTYAGYCNNGQFTKDTNTEYSYDEYGNITKAYTKSQNEDSVIESFAYTEYAYEENQNLLEKYIVALPSHSWITDAAGEKLKEGWLEYDRYGRLRYKEDWLDKQIKTPYSDIQKGLSVFKDALFSQPLSTPKQIKWGTPTSSISYDEFGNPEKIYDSYDRKSSTVYDDKLYIYPVETTNPLGHKTKREYDLFWGQIIQEMGPNGLVTQSDYDGFGRLKAQRTGLWFDPETKTIKDIGKTKKITYEYNLENSPVSVTNKVWIDSTTSIDTITYYDGLGRPMQVRTNTSEGTERWLVSGDKTYNSRGLIEKSFTSYFSNSSSYAFEVNPQTHTYIATYYDALGRKVKVENADNTSLETIYSGNTVTTVTRDSQGNSINSVTITYDAADRVILKTGDTYTTEYKYNLFGKLIWQRTNNDGRTILTMEYDSLSRKTKHTDPDSGTWLYYYDTESNLTLQEDPKGQRIELEYDELNRLTYKKCIYGNGNSNFYAYIYTYDKGDYGIGRLYSVSDSPSLTTYTYDILGNTIENTLYYNQTRFTYTQKSQFDTLGRLTDFTYPDGSQTHYEYYPGGYLYRVSGIYEDNTNYVFAEYSNYNIQGRAQNMRYPESYVSTQISYYDENDKPTYRLKEIVVDSDNEGKIQHLSYDYYDSGNIKEITDYVNTSEGQRFEYDKLSRLTDVKNANGSNIHYAYDSIGNITQKDSININYRNNNPHQVDFINKTNEPNVSLYYDLNGNLEKKQASEHLYQYEYDIEDRLVNFKKDSQTVASYYYDYQGNRIKKTTTKGDILYAGDAYEVNLSKNTATKHIFAGGNKICSITGPGPKVTKTAKGYPQAYPIVFLGSFLLGGLALRKKGAPLFSAYGRLLLILCFVFYTSGIAEFGQAKSAYASTPAGISQYNLNNLGSIPFKISYYHTNHLGSITLTTDGKGKVIERLSYGPYGEVSDKTDGNINSDFSFTGEHYDDETELVYFGKRYYDPNLGLFITQDPEVQFPSPYLYGGGNPINIIDVDGSFGWLVGLLVAVIIASASTATMSAYMSGGSFKDAFVASIKGAHIGAAYGAAGYIAGYILGAVAGSIFRYIGTFSSTTADILSTAYTVASYTVQPAIQFSKGDVMGGMQSIFTSFLSYGINKGISGNSSNTPTVESDKKPRLVLHVAGAGSESDPASVSNIESDILSKYGADVQYKIYTQGKISAFLAATFGIDIGYTLTVYQATQDAIRFYQQTGGEIILLSHSAGSFAHGMVLANLGALNIPVAQSVSADPIAPASYLPNTKIISSQALDGGVTAAANSPFTVSPAAITHGTTIPGTTHITIQERLFDHID